MSIALFTYCLPALLGYTLYVGISGRFDPLSRPSRLSDRPSWLLGLWTGTAVAAVLSVALHMAYRMEPAAARSLLAPLTWSLAAVLLPGLITWFAYRGAVNRRLERETHGLREALRQDMSRQELSSPRPHVHDLFPAGDVAISPAAAVDHVPDDTLDDTLGGAPDTDRPPLLTLLDRVEPMTPDRPERSIAATDPVPTRAAALMAELDGVAREAHEAALAVAEDEMGTLHLALCEEESLRAETEKHLRITRKALGLLESESRDYQSAKADALIALESELESRIRSTAAAEARAARERARRVETENDVFTLKQDLLSARRDLRRNAAARAKALDTASRSVSFARQAVQARARAEEKLKESQAALENRQTTVSSLIRALEKEKRRTQEEVASLAKQLVLHEKQLRARRSLEEVARSVEGKLTTRLARKVAKARPLVSES